MNKTSLILRTGMIALCMAATSSVALAQAAKLEGPAKIRVMTLSKQDIITPSRGALVFDADGIGQAGGAIVSAPFTLKALVGNDQVEISVPEFQLDQVHWVADPIGCEDNDPKTRCHPTWGSEYSGSVGGDLPVSVEFANGGVFSPYGIANLFLNVTVIDNKVRSIDGYLLITYSVPTELPNYRVPLSGKLK